MHSNIIYIDKSSEIPIMGVDFIGIIDRSTNIIELKPITLCNLYCRYCFVSAGEYTTNFMVSSEYLIEKVQDIVSIKGEYDIEIHIAPYGESLLYTEIFDLIAALWLVKGVTTISMQSNGLLLDKESIEKLEKAKLTRINLSLNTLNEETAKYLCNSSFYNMEELLKNIKILLESNINVLLAPVWFPKENDDDIEKIIELVCKLRSEGYSETQIQMGIQKYLIYKTGRKLKKIRPKTWGYFYSQLSFLEKKYKLKLKLGPTDFGIHKRSSILPFNLQKGDLVDLEIVAGGRWERECIGKINQDFGIKVLLRKPLTFSKALIGKRIKAKIIKANYRDNIITASFPLK